MDLWRSGPAGIYRTSVCARLHQMSLQSFTSPTNLCKSRTLVCMLMFLMSSTFEKIGLTPWLLIQKLRYLVYVHPKNYFSAFTFNPDSSSFYYTLSKYFRLLLKFFAVKTRMSAMTHRPLKIPGRICISCLRISRLLKTPVGSPWCLYFSMIVTGCLDTG